MARAGGGLACGVRTASSALLRKKREPTEQHTLRKDANRRFAHSKPRAQFCVRQRGPQCHRLSQEGSHVHRRRWSKAARDRTATRRRTPLVVRLWKARARFKHWIAACAITKSSMLIHLQLNNWTTQVVEAAIASCFAPVSAITQLSACVRCLLHTHAPTPLAC